MTTLTAKTCNAACQVDHVTTKFLPFGIFVEARPYDFFRIRICQMLTLLTGIFITQIFKIKN
jgi:hypothetical protein